MYVFYETCLVSIFYNSLTNWWTILKGEGKVPGPGGLIPYFHEKKSVTLRYKGSVDEVIYQLFPAGGVRRSESWGIRLSFSSLNLGSADMSFATITVYNYRRFRACDWVFEPWSTVWLVKFKFGPKWCEVGYCTLVGWTRLFSKSFYCY